MSGAFYKKKCEICDKEIPFNIRLGKKAYSSRKFCFKNCYTLSMIGKPHRHKTNNEYPAYNKGKKNLPTTGEKNGIWVRDKVSYRALHSWVRRWLGKPKKCEFCGKEKTTPKSVHWANKDHKYKRKLTDWIQLCVSCHKKYDRTLKLNTI